MTTELQVYERDDWTLFRTLQGLAQKAGVSVDKLRRLVLKEIADNGLDVAGRCRVGSLPNGGGYFVEDSGRGIDGSPEDIARLFSINRPLVSTKLLRLPTRGALGNGLRVVAGTVLASEGKLTVCTRNRRITLRPQYDGSTKVDHVKRIDSPVGTRVEIKFGKALPDDSNALLWAQQACIMARHGDCYNGKSAPHWYDAAQFRELLTASGDTPVREFIAQQLEGCSGARAGSIIAAARCGLERNLCRDVTKKQAERLLQIAKENTREVNPKRLGRIGADAWSDNSYAITSGTVDINSVSIPYVIEAWAIKDTRTDLFVYVNRTPITGKINAARDKRDIDAYGCGLADNIATAPKDEQFEIKLSIITPFMPITSDGKEPNLDPFLSGIDRVVRKAVNAARSPKRSSTSIKQVVLDNLDDVIALISTNGKYRFLQRQILYKMRPIVRNEIDKMLKTGTFNGIITDYEYENGEIPGMYRDSRGSIYHPHRKETITLGTLMVENYKRPEWTYNHLLYNEKEGFNAALKDENWPERHDCMLISSKGFSSRAARDLVDKLAEHDEPVKVFIVHDADGYGTSIYQTFQEATKARGARKIKIINLGLEPWEAVEMDLKVETPEDDDDDDDSNGGKKTRRKPVADYVYKYDQENGTDWAEWLQTHRVELNEMTTEEFIEWLTAKLAEHGDGKLIPPPEVLEAELAKRVEAKLREDITERILREARLDEQVAAAVAATEMPDADELADGIEEMFEEDPAHEWRDHIEDCANQAVGREMEEG